ncbi:MAG: tetratricopeptide repeat protein [Candidatus Hydrogenedentes bacterium]|nr:tetratricopeptide repeat protein [Candidatus Hydrogenedentota bacterium]
MAQDPKKKKVVKSLFDDHKVEKSDWAAFVEQVKENPALYAGAAVFIVVCFLLGVLYRGHSLSAKRELLTQYAEAQKEYEPAKLVAALEPLADGRGEIHAEITYMLGEAALRASEYDKAKQAFEKVRSQFPDSENVADAVEGLGFVAEQQNDPDAAIAYYREVSTKWPKSFAARKQSLNIGRVEEARGRFKEAMDAYKEVSLSFAGSHAASDAQAAIDRLAKEHPELAPPPAPAEAAPAEGAPAAGETPTDVPKLNLTVPVSPTPEAPAASTEAEMPAEPAPAAPAAETPPAADSAAAPAAEQTPPPAQ